MVLFSVDILAALGYILFLQYMQHFIFLHVLCFLLKQNTNFTAVRLQCLSVSYTSSDSCLLTSVAPEETLGGV